MQSKYAPTEITLLRTVSVAATKYVFSKFSFGFLSVNSVCRAKLRTFSYVRRGSVVGEYLALLIKLVRLSETNWNLI